MHLLYKNKFKHSSGITRFLSHSEFKISNEWMSSLQLQHTAIIMQNTAHTAHREINKYLFVDYMLIRLVFKQTCA